MFNLITFFERLHLVCPTFSSHLSLSLFFLSVCLFFSRRLFRLFVLHVFIFLYLSNKSLSTLELL